MNKTGNNNTRGRQEEVKSTTEAEEQEGETTEGVVKVVAASGGPLTVANPSPNSSCSSYKPNNKNRLKEEIETMTQTFVAHCRHYGYQLSKLLPPMVPMETCVQNGGGESEKEEETGTNY